MSLTCRRTRRRLPAVVDSSLEDLRLEAHLAGCLRCQAEASRYRRIAREMAELAMSLEPAPSWMVAAVADSVPESSDSEAVLLGPSSSGPQAATKVAVAGALAAAAGTAVAVRLVRSRPIG